MGGEPQRHRGALGGGDGLAGRVGAQHPDHDRRVHLRAKAAAEQVVLGQHSNDALDGSGMAT